MLVRWPLPETADGQQLGNPRTSPKSYSIFDPSIDHNSFHLMPVTVDSALHPMRCNNGSPYSTGREKKNNNSKAPLGIRGKAIYVTKLTSLACLLQPSDHYTMPLAASLSVITAWHILDIDTIVCATQAICSFSA